METNYALMTQKDLSVTSTKSSTQTQLAKYGTTRKSLPPCESVERLVPKTSIALR